HREAPAQALLQAVPALHRVVGRSSPRLDGAGLRLLLLVGAAEEHPLAVLVQHRVQVLDAAQVVAELRLSDLHHEGRRIGALLAPRLVLARARWRPELPRRALRTAPLHPAYWLLLSASRFRSAAYASNAGPKSGSDQRLISARTSGGTCAGGRVRMRISAPSAVALSGSSASARPISRIAARRSSSPPRASRASASSAFAACASAIRRRCSVSRSPSRKRSTASA